MTYVFDNGPFSTLYRNFFKSVFPTLWENFDTLVASRSIVSVREVLNELDGSSDDELKNWAKENAEIFHSPSADEAAFIRKIYSVPHFLQNIDTQKLLKGGYVADPYVIAKAKIEGRTVVTTEKYKENAAKIPNICKHFGVSWMSLQMFMEAEGWKF